MKTKIEIDDVVPYVNTRGNWRLTKVTKIHPPGTVHPHKEWFDGIDTLTSAKTFYPTHLSLDRYNSSTHEHNPK